jgi:hypothetical protein
MQCRKLTQWARSALASRALGLLVVGLGASTLTGCAGHEARTLKVRTALDQGEPKAAIAALNEELEVKSDKDLPAKLEGDNALLVLDRASIQQSLVQFEPSKHDFEAADKAIDMLDLAHNASDSIGKYIYSDSAGRYQAPPYEKLLINTLNLLNYLETHDLNGAQIEARRLSVMQKYYKDSLAEGDDAILGLGSLLAGFAYEKSGDADEALRYYDEALHFSGKVTLAEPVRRLMQKSGISSPRLREVAGSSGDGRGGGDDGSQRAPAEDDSAEIMFVLGFGRVPHKIPERIPIGLALTLVAADISPADRNEALRLEAQGLVTWVNFPTLAPSQGEYTTPECKLDGRFIQLEQAVDVAHEVRAEWKKIEGKVILSAITRMVARYAVGEGIRAAAGKDNSAIGMVGSLAAQATLTALDTPDTRSWETLPARVAVARVRVPAGRHVIALQSRGWTRNQQLDLQPKGWAVVSLMGLR